MVHFVFKKKSFVFSKVYKVVPDKFPACPNKDTLTTQLYFIHESLKKEPHFLDKRHKLFKLKSEGQL